MQQSSIAKSQHLLHLLSQFIDTSERLAMSQVSRRTTLSQIATQAAPSQHTNVCIITLGLPFKNKSAMVIPIIATLSLNLQILNVGVVVLSMSDSPSVVYDPMLAEMFNETQTVTDNTKQNRNNREKWGRTQNSNKSPKIFKPKQTKLSILTAWIEQIYYTKTHGKSSEHNDSNKAKCQKLKLSEVLWHMNNTKVRRRWKIKRMYRSSYRGR